MRLRQLLNILSRYPALFLSIGIVAYILIFSGLSFWKYNNFLYNALDLGIYSQVFESFRAGNYWYSSIQQSNYLGDHFEPFILVLLPFYLLIPHPKTLLVLQTIFLAIPTIPIFFIAREVFYPHLASPLARGRNGGGLQNQTPNLWALGVSFFYLLNPLVHNINLFEFHLLPFSLIFLFSAAYFYITTTPSPSLVRRGVGRYFLFLLFCFLALLIREDIPLIVFMFGVLALIERRRWYWIAGPMILGAWWFLLSTGIIASFNIEGGYKFLTYYNHILGGSIFEIIGKIIFNLVIHPGNWLISVLFLLIFLFLPIFSPRYLLLALPVILQFFLTDSGADDTVLFSHYSTLFLPALFLSGIFGAQWLMSSFIGDHCNNNLLKFIFKDRGLLITTSIFVIICLIVVLSPAGNFVPLVNAGKKRSVTTEETSAQKALIGSISNQSAVVLSAPYLPARWSSQNASALYWTSMGFKQLSFHQYVPDFSTDYALMDSEDLLASIFSHNDSQNGDNRIRDFLEERKFFVHDYIDRFVLFSKEPSKEELYEILNSLPQNKEKEMELNNKIVDWDMNIKLAAFSPPETSRISIGATDKFLIASFPLFWEKIKNTDRIYVMNILLCDSRGKIVVSKNYPLSYSLYLASDWETGKIIQTNQRILLPDNLNGEYKVHLRLINATNGSFVLDQIRSGMVSVPDKPIGEEIFLGEIIAPYK